MTKQECEDRALDILIAIALNGSKDWPITQDDISRYIDNPVILSPEDERALATAGVKFRRFLAERQKKIREVTPELLVANLALRDALRAEAKRREMEGMGEADTLKYAQQLATNIWENHFQKKSPDWKPLDTIAGVLTQIDNMVAGMERKKEDQP